MQNDDDMFSILTCPICKGELKKDQYGEFLFCVPCDRKYPIIEGIPDLRVEDKK